MLPRFGLSTNHNISLKSPNPTATSVAIRIVPINILDAVSMIREIVGAKTHNINTIIIKIFARALPPDTLPFINRDEYNTPTIKVDRRKAPLRSAFQANLFTIPKSDKDIKRGTINPTIAVMMIACIDFFKS